MDEIVNSMVGTFLDGTRKIQSVLIKISITEVSFLKHGDFVYKLPWYCVALQMVHDIV